VALRALAAVAAALLLFAVVDAPRASNAQSGMLRLAAMQASCVGMSVGGSVSIVNTGSAETSARVSLYVSYQAAGNDWQRAPDPTPVELNVPGGATVSVGFGPLTAAMPGGVTALRAEAVLDKINVGPGGAVTVTPNVDAVASPVACRFSPAGAPSTEPELQAGTFDSACVGTAVTGGLGVVNGGGTEKQAHVSVFLAYFDEGQWIRTGGVPQRLEASLVPGASVTFSYTLQLNGMPADVYTVRAEADLATVEIVGGQAIRRSKTVVSTPATCTPPPEPAEDGAGAYTVVLGDNLIRIARRHGISTDQLAKANGIDTKTRVRVGQQLTIPARGASPTPGTAPSPSPTATSTTTPRPATGTSGNAPQPPRNTPRATAAPTEEEPDDEPSVTPTPKGKATATPTAKKGATTAAAGVVTPNGRTPAGTPGASPTPEGEKKQEKNSPFQVMPMIVGAMGMMILLVGGFGAMFFLRGRNKPTPGPIAATPMIRPEKVRPQGPDALGKIAGAPAPAVQGTTAAAVAAPAAAPAPVPANNIPAGPPPDDGILSMAGRPRRRSALAQMFLPEEAGAPSTNAIVQDASGLMDELRRKRAA
jgi:LysM repeat protein